MFKLLRWVVVLGVIGGVGAFVWKEPARAKAGAEHFCKLIESPECSTLLARGATSFTWLQSRWANATQRTAETGASKVAAHERATHPAPAGEPLAGPAGPPLDRHTAAERRALDKVLTDRGSR